MSFIKTRTVRGVRYFALVEKVKREDGTWGLKQLKSYGTEDPRGTNEVIPLTEQLEKPKLETKAYEKIPEESPYDTPKRRTLIKKLFRVPELETTVKKEGIWRPKW